MRTKSTNHQSYYQNWERLYINLSLKKHSEMWSYPVMNNKYIKTLPVKNRKVPLKVAHFK